MRRHHTGNKFYRGHIALEASRQGYPGIRDGVLVVDSNYRQALAMPNVAAKGLKVSDHQLNLVFINQMRQLFQAAYSARRLDQVAGQRSLITYAIIYVSETQAKNFSDSEALTQIAQPAVKRHYVQLVSLLLQVSDERVYRFAARGAEPESGPSLGGPGAHAGHRSQAAQYRVEVFSILTDKLQPAAAA